MSTLWKDYNSYNNCKNTFQIYRCFLVHLQNIENLDTMLLPFYLQCVKQRQQVLISIQYKQTPAMQMIWNKKKVKIDRRSMYFSDFSKVDLWTIADIYDNSTLRGFEFWQGK